MKGLIVGGSCEKTENETIRIAVFRVHIGQGGVVEEVLVKIDPRLVSVGLVPGNAIVTEGEKGEEEVKGQKDKKRKPKGEFLSGRRFHEDILRLS